MGRFPKKGLPPKGAQAPFKKTSPFSKLTFPALKQYVFGEGDKGDEVTSKKRARSFEKYSRHIWC
jgi:hypothetical protein